MYWYSSSSTIKVFFCRHNIYFQAFYSKWIGFHRQYIFQDISWFCKIPGHGKWICYFQDAWEPCILLSVRANVHLNSAFVTSSSLLNIFYTCWLIFFHFLQSICLQLPTYRSPVLPMEATENPQIHHLNLALKMLDPAQHQSSYLSPLGSVFSSQEGLYLLSLFHPWWIHQTCNKSCIRSHLQGFPNVFLSNKQLIYAPLFWDHL